MYKYMCLACPCLQKAQDKLPPPFKTFSFSSLVITQITLLFSFRFLTTIVNVEVNVFIHLKIHCFLHSKMHLFFHHQNADIAMIYTIGGIKGGSGKTTLATNLLAYLVGKGRDVLLVDADDQESATDFTGAREETTNGKTGYTAIRLSEKQVLTEVKKQTSKYDDIVIDTGGRDTVSQRAALAVADIYLVPFVPRSLDVWTLEKVEALIEEVSIANPNLSAFSFLNRADHQGQDNKDAAELLKESETVIFLETVIGNRKVFSNAAASGLGVLEYKPKDEKAIKELNSLFKEIGKKQLQKQS